MESRKLSISNQNFCRKVRKTKYYESSINEISILQIFYSENDNNIYYSGYDYVIRHNYCGSSVNFFFCWIFFIKVVKKHRCNRINVIFDFARFDRRLHGTPNSQSCYSHAFRAHHRFSR